MAKNKKKAKKKSSSKEAPENTIVIKLEWIIAAVLGVLLIISVLTQGFSNLPLGLKLPFASNILGESVVDMEKAKGDAAEFINEVILQGQSSANITEISEDEATNMYKVKLEIDGQEYTSYITKNGKYLFATEPQEITTSEEDPEQATKEYPKSDKPEVLLFTMSYCPYGNEAENFVEPVARLLKDKANIEPHYVIYNEKDYGYKGKEYCLDNENKYCSMHGVGELNQGVRELCVYRDQKDKFWDFVMAANSDCTAENIEKCWTKAAKKAGVNVDKVKQCQANESIALLKKEVELNKKYDVSGSPTIVLNGEQYEGQRSPETFKQAVCSAFNSSPGSCDTTLENSNDGSAGSCN